MSNAVLQHKVTELEFNSGIDRAARESLADKLSNSLSEVYRLLVNTQIVHWNTQGPLFFSIHKLTESHYENLFKRVDDIAERIRALGMPAPRSAKTLFERASMKDLPTEADVESQLRGLVAMNDNVVSGFRKLAKAADESTDYKTADLATDMIGELEEATWMLRATFSSPELK